MLRFENLTTTQYLALPRENTCVVIPVSPLEVHGPHSPYGADAFIARYTAEECARRMGSSRPNWKFLFHPLIYAGSDTQNYPGSVEIPPLVVKGYIQAIAQRFAKDGFARILIVSCHAGPRYMVALEQVAVSLSKGSCRAVVATGAMMPNVLPRPLVARLVERLKARGTAVDLARLAAALPTDYHAGLVETSFCLLLAPELTNSSYSNLKPVVIENPLSIRRDSSQKCGEGLGFLGHPALAHKDIALELTDLYFEKTLPPLLRFLDENEKLNSTFRSMYYWLPPFWPQLPRLIAALLAVGGAVAFWHLRA